MPRLSMSLATHDARHDIASVQYLIRLHRHRLQLVAIQNQPTFKTGVTCFAEFKTIGAAQHSAPGLVAYQRQPDISNRVIQKLHVRIAASFFPRLPRDFKGASVRILTPAETIAWIEASS